MGTKSMTPAKVLFAATIGLAFSTSPVSSSSFSTLIIPLSQTYGWERGVISPAMTILSVFNAIMGPILGWLTDRYGARKVLIPSITFYGLGLASVALLQDAVWQLYLTYAFLGIVGGGTSAATYSRLIVAWFANKRGMALGTAMGGMGVGLIATPLLCQSITGAIGWRAAFVAMGLLVILTTLPFVLLWAVDPPRKTSAQGQAAPTVEWAGATLREAVKTRNFSLLVLSFALSGLLTGAIPSHLVPLLSDNGISAMKAASLASIFGIAVIVGRLGLGLLLDRFPVQALTSSIGVIAFSGLALLLAKVTGLWAALAIFLLGCSIAAESMLIPFLISRYFGLRAFTSISGFMMIGYVVGICIGPMLMAYSSDLVASYDLAIKVLMVTTALATIPFLLLAPHADAPDLAQNREPAPLDTLLAAAPIPATER